MLNALTTTSVGAAFVNLDGLGRNDRVRYDTPVLGPGLRLSASLVTEDIYDIALNFANDNIAGLQIAAALAYSNDDGVDSRIGGSISVLHSSGFNITFAAAVEDVDGPGADPRFWSIKLGFKKEFMAMGESRFAIDFYRGDETEQVSDEATAIGAGIVQKIDAIATEFYLGLRNYNLERDNADLNNIFAVITGARIKF